MELAPVIESLLMAAQEPLTSAELVALIRDSATQADVPPEELPLDQQPPNPPPDPDLEEEAPIPVDPERKSPADSWEHLKAVTEPEVTDAINTLNDHYQQQKRAFFISARAKGWAVFTRPDYATFVSRLFPERKPERLSAAALETLAIIAYRQPVTKSVMESVRGVSCDGMVQRLLDRELVKICGRADLPGRPLLYATTDAFLEHLGLAEVALLPNFEELKARDLPTMEAPEEELTLEGESFPEPPSPDPTPEPAPAPVEAASPEPTTSSHAPE